MAQFDVHKNTGKHRATIPYVVVVQSALFEKSRRRVVVPLVALDMLNQVASLPSSKINPVFTIHRINAVLNPLEIVSIPAEQLGEQVGSLAEDSDAVIAALDELLSRAWN